MKQLCTNLVVKLDLPMDVSDIDRVVASAGAFEDDAVVSGDTKPEKVGDPSSDLVLLTHPLLGLL